MMPAVVVLHPWNVDFAWEDHPGPFRRLTAEQVAAFDRDGYLVVRDVLGSATLAEVVATVDKFEARADAYLAGLDGGRLAIAEHGAITFSVHLVARFGAAGNARPATRSSSISVPISSGRTSTCTGTKRCTRSR